jgi:hypothetical protein
MSEFKPSTLRPGLIVALRTSMSGNVNYRKQDIERDHLIGDATRFAKWETERTISDADEYERAVKVRSEATYTVAKVCASTAFGYLCPEENASKLGDAIAAARALIDGFNSTAKITRVTLNVITGRVAPDDVEAVRAIREELAGLMSDMEAGVTALSPSKIRDAAARAKQLSSMLTEQSKQDVESAVEAARSAATKINKAVKAGEQAALVMDQEVLKTLQGARTSFLDLDTTAETVHAPVAPARALELTPEAGVCSWPATPSSLKVKRSPSGRKRFARPSPS